MREQYDSTVSILFDRNSYLEHNPDVASAGIDPLAHYMNYGWKEGRNPSELFNTNYYLENNSDVRNAGINPLVHYAQNGWKEGRDPSASFDTSYYLEHNPDVASAGIDPLVHYITYGKAEGRLPKDQFDIEVNDIFDIEVNYTYDTTGFFTLHSEREAVVEEACKIWEGIIGDEFEDVPAGTTIEVINPSNGHMENITLTQKIDDFRLYLGSYRANDSSLGLSRSLSQSHTGNTQLDDRYNSYTNIEPWVGSVAFNETYADQFYFDLTSADSLDDTVPDNKYDFLHMILHEIGHALGMGPQNAGSQYVTTEGNNVYFSGPHTTAVYGGSVPLDLNSGTHFSPDITMGALMKPSLHCGERVLPTALDKAFFADIGYVIQG